MKKFSEGRAGGRNIFPNIRLESTKCIAGILEIWHTIIKVLCETMEKSGYGC